MRRSVRVPLSAPSAGARCSRTTTRASKPCSTPGPLRGRRWRGGRSCRCLRAERHRALSLSRGSRRRRRRARARLPVPLPSVSALEAPTSQKKGREGLCELPMRRSERGFEATIPPTTRTEPRPTASGAASSPTKPASMRATARSPTAPHRGCRWAAPTSALRTGPASPSITPANTSYCLERCAAACRTGYR